MLETDVLQLSNIDVETLADWFLSSDEARPFQPDVEGLIPNLGIECRR